MQETNTENNIGYNTEFKTGVNTLKVLYVLLIRDFQYIIYRFIVREFSIYNLYQAVQ